MISAIARLLERYLNVPHDRGMVILNRLVVVIASMLFILLATIVVAFDDIFASQTGLASLQVGDIAPSDIYAPEATTYASDVLTQQRREEARAAVRPIYDPPDPAVARQQTDLARQVLDYIENVRRDPFAEMDQKIRDLQQITALALDEETARQILEIDNDTWQDVDSQIISVLERVLRGEVQESDLPQIRARLPNEVSVVRFSDRETDVIVAIVSDLIRANTRLNEEATAREREEAAEAVQVETRSFERGQIVVTEGSRIGPADYEALRQLGLLRSTSRRTEGIARALLANVIIMVVTGLYAVRFRRSLIYDEPRTLSLLAAVFLLVLAGARLGLSGQIYIYPTAALALVYAALVSPEIAIIGVLALAFLIGLMADNSLELAMLVTVGGMIGSLTLRRSERLNSYFVAGLLVALGNIAVVMLFRLGDPAGSQSGETLLMILYSLLNGILTAAAALAAMYIITLIFNLPTALKLAELSQPNQPLMQRLLREAPGTYQHTLQVANLAEQAANTIGANAELTHVASLYHDIGKMLNPAFFTENQRDIGNPHDALNDPYRSADIIISHVTEGDNLARQYRLPNRIRDFIREHHGTSQVYVFYKQAVILAGDDESLVDVSDFTYPGPKPRSRETAVLMLADSCEAAIRSRQPKNKQEIEDTVQQVINGKRDSGQLDDSGLTMKDLKAIQRIFIEMLQAIFHPRIDYAEAVARVRKTGTQPMGVVPIPTPSEKREPEAADGKKEPSAGPAPGTAQAANTRKRSQSAEMTSVLDDDDAPLAEVPRLRRVGDTKELPSHEEDDQAEAEDKSTEEDSKVEKADADSDQMNP